MKIDVILRKEQRAVGRMTAEAGGDGEKQLLSAIDQAKEVLDVSRPLILTKHIRDFDRFGRAVFLASEFMEPVAFDRMEVEALKKPSDNPDED